MGHDVVKLARDSGSLIGDRGLNLLLPLCLQLGGASLEAVAAQLAVAKRLAERP